MTIKYKVQIKMSVEGMNRQLNVDALVYAIDLASKIKYMNDHYFELQRKI